MIAQNKKEFDLTGVSLWQSLGYTGKGITIAELESSYIAKFFDGMLSDPFGICGNTPKNSHGQFVFDIIHQVAPEAKLYSLPSTLVINAGIPSGALLTKTFPFILEKKIDIVGASLYGDMCQKEIDFVEKARLQGTTFNACAGNTGKLYTNEYGLNGLFNLIGAVHIDDSGKIIKAPYSSLSPELDFMSPSNLYVYNSSVDGQIYGSPITGTSFSTPFFSGMCALVQEFFLNKTGKKLNPFQLYLFMKEYSEDYGIDGIDNSYGNGFVVLPNPSDIDVQKYIGGEDVTIVLTIGSKIATVNGTKVTLNEAPTIINGITMIPARFVAENFGMKVSYTVDSVTGKVKTVTIQD